MNYPNIDYKIQGETVAPDIILTSLNKYLQEWIKISKGSYVECLIVDFMGIRKLYKSLKECMKIYKGNKNNKEKLVDIGERLYPSGAHAYSGSGVVFSSAQRPSQIQSLAKDIKRLFEKNNYKLENWDVIYKSIKGSNLSKKIPADTKALLVKLVFIQNEIFKVAGRKQLKNKLSKDFANNLQEFVAEAEPLAAHMNGNSSLINLTADIQKLASGKINMDSDKELLNDISEDAVEVSEELALLENKLVVPSSKSLSSKLKSLFSKRKDSVKKMKSSKEKAKFFKVTIKENKSKLLKLSKEIKKIRNEKKKNSIKKIVDPKGKENTPSIKQLDAIEKATNSLIEKQKILNNEYKEKIQN